MNIDNLQNHILIIVSALIGIALIFGSLPSVFSSFSTITSNSSDCFQETANVSTSCGGLSTGNYMYSYQGEVWINSGNLFDANYSTNSTRANPLISSNARLQVNYTKPTGFSNSTWQVKFSNNSISYFTNYTVPQDCIDYSSDRIVFNVFQGNGQEIILGCWNSTTTSDTGNGFHIINRTGATNGTSFYEEGINWNITTNTTSYGNLSSLFGSFIILVVTLLLIVLYWTKVRVK